MFKTQSSKAEGYLAIYSPPLGGGVRGRGFLSHFFARHKSNTCPFEPLLTPFLNAILQVFDSLQVARPLKTALLRPFFDLKYNIFCKHISLQPYIINWLPHPPKKPVKHVTLSPCPPVTLSLLTLSTSNLFTCQLVNLSNSFVLSTQHQYALRYQLPVHFPLGKHDAYLRHLPYGNQETYSDVLTLMG